MHILIPEERELIHEMVAPIRWGDMDVYASMALTSSPDHILQKIS